MSCKIDLSIIIFLDKFRGWKVQEERHLSSNIIRSSQYLLWRDLSMSRMPRYLYGRVLWVKSWMQEMCFLIDKGVLKKKKKIWYLMLLIEVPKESLKYLSMDLRVTTSLTKGTWGGCYLWNDYGRLVDLCCEGKDRWGSNSIWKL